MNKIYKVMYSKVKQCCVVVSEIAKSHSHNGENSSVRKHTALMAAVLIALGSLSFTTVPTVHAFTATRTDGADFVGVERTDGTFEDSDYANYKGQGAHGDNSITIGLKASGSDGTITIGDRRAEQSLGSVYVGRGPGMPTGKVLPDKTDDGYWATSVGYQSDATGYGSIAIGSNATANNSYDKDSTGHGITLRTTSGDGKTVVINGKPDIQRASVAIGYGASADNGNIAIGSYSDASTDLRTAKDDSAEAYLTKSKADSYVSVGKSDALRRISNVADGAADSDVATISQLRKAVEETDASKKANIDASNIGKNLKFKADGKTAADSTDITTNEDAWGAAIGTGKNLSALDSKIGKLDETKKYNYIDSKESTSISDNLTKLDTQVKKNADDITNINKSIGTLDQNAVKYDNSNKSKVTLAGADGTTITNLKAGEVKDTSKDAVNGSQLYAEQNARTAADTKLTNDLAAETQARTDADTAINNKIGTLDKDGNYIKKDASVSSNLSTLDTQVKTTSDLIHTKGDTIQIGGSSTATKIDVRGKDKDGKSTGRIITGVVTDAADPTSAANVGYVNGVTAANTQQIYRDMNNAYGRLNNNINKAAAGSNALAALHPLDYDPDDKADFAVGYGHYRNANAAAVGAFYHPNENTMVNVGVSLGNGDPGFNAGVSFKVGRGGAGHEAMSKTEMAKVINSQSKEIDALKKDNADKDKRIDALEQKMAEILAKLNKNGK